MTTAQLDRMPHEFRKKQFLCPWLEEQWFWASNSKGSRPGEMQQKNWQNPKMAEKVLLVRTSPKVGWLYDTFGLWAVSCAFAQSAILFVGWRVEQTTRTKLLLLKLSKINPIISLGFPKKSKTMVVWRVTYHLDYCSFSLSLSGCFLSKLENHLDHLVRRISVNRRIIPNTPSYVSHLHFQSTMFYKVCSYKKQKVSYDEYVCFLKNFGWVKKITLACLSVKKSTHSWSNLNKK